ncbi:hypothetical protein [Bacillus cereus]|uniref:hypothetical protein n=1 Tax=Bacillus cereus TaxID=1396 RepID=UPI0009951F97|nr:hypothetical protein [Bacillus cereus]OOZ90070.1 hypothetical protein BHL25_04995 [Bacillus cereus]
MGNYEQKNKKPLVVANIYKYADHYFLVAAMYEGGHIVANIVAPVHQIVEEGGTIPNKLREIVLLNSHNPSENMVFDLWTSTDMVYRETLKDVDINGQLVDESKTTETRRTIDNIKVRESIVLLLEEDEENRLKALVEAQANRSVAETKAAAAAAPQETETKRSLFGKICDWFAEVWRGLKV